MKIDFITKFNETGICEIDVDILVKKWNDLFSISQWHDEYRLIKLKKKNITENKIKITISEDQFFELKRKLNLYQFRSTLFRNGSTWRKV
jgi:hypothetical protein